MICEQVYIIVAAYNVSLEIWLPTQITLKNDGVQNNDLQGNL